MVYMNVGYQESAASNFLSLSLARPNFSSVVIFFLFLFSSVADLLQDGQKAVSNYLFRLHLVIARGFGLTRFVHLGSIVWRLDGMFLLAIRN